MPRQDEHKSYHEELEIHKRNLDSELLRAAQYGGEVFAPAEVRNAIYQARENIRRIEADIATEQTKLQLVSEPVVQEKRIRRWMSVFFNGINDKQAWHGMMLRPLYILAAIVFVLVVIGIFLTIKFGVFMRAAATHVVIGTLSSCPLSPSSLADTLSGDSQVAVSEVDEFFDTSIAHPLPNAELVVWGTCEHGLLHLTLSLKQLQTPFEVIDLERIIVTLPAQDIDQAARLLRALVQYQSHSYTSAASSLVPFLHQVRTSNERAALSFIHANSLLYSGQYDAAIDAYGDAIANEEMRYRAHQNRGVARYNLANRLILDTKNTAKYQQVLADAVSDLTFAATAPDTKVAILALFNRANADALVGSITSTTIKNCDKIIDYDATNPLGYFCRASVQFWEYYLLDCNPPPPSSSIDSDLDTVNSLLSTKPQPQIYTQLLFVSAGHLRLKSQCASTKAEQQQYITKSNEIFQKFTDQMNKQRPQLEIHTFLLTQAKPL